MTDEKGTTLPKGVTWSVWLWIALPVTVMLIAGTMMAWVAPLFAAVVAIITGVTFLVWLRHYEQRLRQHLADERAEELRRALRSQRLALGVPVVDSLPNPLLILNKRRDITLANRAARDLFGRTVVGRDIAFIMRQPHVLALVDKTLETAAPGMSEVSLIAPVPRDFQVMVAPILAPDEEGGAPQAQKMSPEQPAVAMSLHEITEIRRVESMRADFVANASHELKTPLANLVGFIETLKGPARDDSDARDRFLSIMQQEASRMSRLINDLLSLSRIELDEHVRPDSAVELQPLLAGVVKLMDMRAQNSDISIVMEEVEEPPVIQGDSDQLIQVFQNLLDNAVKYGRSGGTIRISFKRVPRLPQGREPGILVSVADEGEGIDPEHLPRLTERFYRVDPGRSQRLGGTGLGLAIVKHIVRRHRGWLDIKSEKGKGTTVTIGLPLLNERVLAEL